MALTKNRIRNIAESDIEPTRTASTTPICGDVSDAGGLLRFGGSDMTSFVIGGRLVGLIFGFNLGVDQDDGSRARL